MGYVNSIGGDPINPNPFTYSAVSMTGDITLGWPISGQSPTYSATDWVDVTSSAAYAIKMPDATQVGTGREVVFNNYGAYTITINDNAGGGITTIAAGFSKRVYVVTNATAAGTWRVVNIGAGTSAADASALAGYGLVANAGVLSQQYPVVLYNTNQTIISGSRAGLAIWTGGAGTFTMTSPATLGANWFFNVRNSGSGSLTINAGSALINGSSTLAAAVGEGFTVITDGTNFYTIGKVAPNSSSLTLLNKSVAGNTDVTLTAGESAYSIINFTGALTGNINVIVPTAVASWYFYNNTTGSYTLTVKTVAGTGVAITQTGRTILYCDGTNVVTPIPASTGGTVTSVTAGTGLSGGVITTTGTVALANTAVAAGSYGSTTQVGTFTVDAQGRLSAAANSTIAIGTSNIASNAITNALLATMAANTVKGSIAGGTPEDLTQTQLTTLINAFTSSLSGAVPASGGGTTNYLRADGTFAAPPGVITTSGSLSSGYLTILNNGTVVGMIQAGFATGGAITFPTTFPSAAISVVTNIKGNAGSGDSTYFSITALSTTGFTIATSYAHYYIAIGY